jgi:hypothetical protein
MSYQVFGDETRTARRDHVCAYCDGKIRAGTTYRRWVSVEDAVGTVKAHLECVSLWHDIAPGEDEIPSEPYEFRQDCHACGGPGPFPWECS